MKKIKTLLRGALVAGFFSASALYGGVVTEITIGDFVAPVIEDFEGEATGNVTGLESVFSAIGISSISGDAETYTDDFQDREHSSSRALWFTAGNHLTIVDPSSSEAAIYGQQDISYTINFSAPIFRFGFSTHDEPFESRGADPLTITFFSGAVNVGSISTSGVLWAGSGPNPDWDRRDFFFANTDSFDRIVLTTDPTGNQGFALDNFTVEASALIPEPGSLMLLGLGLVGLAAVRRRHKR